MRNEVMANRIQLIRALCRGIEVAGRLGIEKGLPRRRWEWKACLLEVGRDVFGSNLGLTRPSWRKLVQIVRHKSGHFDGSARTLLLFQRANISYRRMRLASDGRCRVWRGRRDYGIASYRSICRKAEPLKDIVYYSLPRFPFQRRERAEYRLNSDELIIELARLRFS